MKIKYVKRKKTCHPGRLLLLLTQDVNTVDQYWVLSHVRCGIWGCTGKTMALTNCIKFIVSLGVVRDFRFSCWWLCWDVMSWILSFLSPICIPLFSMFRWLLLEDGDNRFLRNLGNNLSGYTASNPNISIVFLFLTCFLNNKCDWQP
jgi:hypothetical protein